MQLSTTGTLEHETARKFPVFMMSYAFRAIKACNRPVLSSVLAAPHPDSREQCLWAI